jgi:HNH endonuclease
MRASAWPRARSCPTEPLYRAVGEMAGSEEIATSETYDAGRGGETSSGPIELPPFQPIAGWPIRPGVNLVVKLDNDAPAARNALEESYAAGLVALSHGDFRAALESFRSVVTTDGTGEFSTALLLVHILSCLLGDDGAASAVYPRLSHARPDQFAQERVADASLELYSTGESGSWDVLVEECLDQPLTTAHVACAGCLIGLGQIRAAAEALEAGVPLWEARNAAWEEEKRRRKVEYERLIEGIKRPPIRNTMEEIRREQPETAPKSDWEIEGEAKRRQRDDEARKRQEAEEEAANSDRSGPRGDAGGLKGFDSTVCALYEKLGDYDAVVRWVDSNAHWPGSRVTRARALHRNGLSDAALVTLDEYLRKPDSADGRNSARYLKASILIDQQQRHRARRELAQLFSDNPRFDDHLGLQAKSESHTSERGNRVAIPEKVRHAVWRRDEGRCVECGCKENLEYDHIIPLSRGGSNTERNLQILCEACNRRKSDNI